MVQLATKLKKPTSATTGAASGSATRRKTPNSEQPSSRAASSRSRGQRGGEVDVGQVHAERVERVRQDDRPHRADQVHRVDLQEQRHHQRGVRHEHHDQGGDQQGVPAAELGHRQRVPGRDGHAQGDDQGERTRTARSCRSHMQDGVVLERGEARPSWPCSACQEPKDSGLPCTSCWSVLVAASTATAPAARRTPGTTSSTEPVSSRGTRRRGRAPPLGGRWCARLMTPGPVP